MNNAIPFSTQRAMGVAGAIALLGLVSAAPVFAVPPDAPPAAATAAKPAPAAKPATKTHYATSTVKDYAAATRSLTLATGRTYVLDAMVKDDGLKTGQKVKVRYAMQGAERHADRITFLKH